MTCGYRLGFTVEAHAKSKLHVAPPFRKPAPFAATSYVPPSRKNRKSFTTWQGETALSELCTLSHETGKSQQRLVAEALNLMLTKYGKRTVATWVWSRSLGTTHRRAAR